VANVGNDPLVMEGRPARLTTKNDGMSIYEVKTPGEKSDVKMRGIMLGEGENRRRDAGAYRNGLMGDVQQLANFLVYGRKRVCDTRMTQWLRGLLEL
jgi:hypothetical protein